MICLSWVYLRKLSRNLADGDQMLYSDTAKTDLLSTILHGLCVKLRNKSFSTYCFRDTVPAFFDAWFLGDRFLADIFNNFWATIHQTTRDKKSVSPYLSEYYNIKLPEKAGDSSVPLVMAQAVNALMDAINEKHARLPKYLIVVLDKDPPNDLHLSDLDALRMVPMLVNWFTRQINTILRRKRVDLLEKKAGAVSECPT